MQKQQKQYTEITVSTTHEASELVAYFLGEVSPFGVTILDKHNLDEISSWDYKSEDLQAVQSQVVQVNGYVESDNLASSLEFLKQSFSSLDSSFCGKLEISTRQVDADAWLKVWQTTFTPIEIGNIVICPEWIETPKLKNNQRVLKIQSGIAFGTGQHETTQMCLTLLQKQSLTGMTVADIGCGSGILGLSSLLLGAKSATLIDIDSQATDISQHNAKLNNLQDKAEVILGNLADKLTQKFDLVLANLTAEILYILAQDIQRIVKSEGKVILSGILADRADKVIECFCACGLEVAEQICMGEWVALTLKSKIV